jgi:ketosteroid isomerase-like protein
MSQENVETLKRAFDAFASGDLETVFGFIDPAFQINDRVIGSPSARGPDALIANAAEVREAVGDVSWEPREIVDLGDRALVKVHVAGAGQHTSLPIHGDVGHIYTFRDGKAVKLDIFRTWDEARRVAGLSAR